jgi:hypothetical protein
MSEPTDSISRKPAPRWMPWATSGCIALFLTTALLTDLNGNVVISENPRIPDLLNPAPGVIMLLTLGAAMVIALAHALKYPSRRFLGLGIFVFLAVLGIATVLPAL